MVPTTPLNRRRKGRIRTAEAAEVEEVVTDTEVVTEVVVDYSDGEDE